MNTTKKWVTNNSKLYKQFEFNDFAEALQFVNKVGELAEKANHHPDITFGWGYAEISLYSHDQNKISDKDYNLANKIDII